jgi:hypothetical protein
MSGRGRDFQPAPRRGFRGHSIKKPASHRGRSFRLPDPTPRIAASRRDRLSSRIPNGSAASMPPPRNRYVVPPMDLENMRSHGVHAIDVTCVCCRRERLDVSWLPGSVGVPSLKDRLRCKVCGSRPMTCGRTGRSIRRPEDGCRSRASPGDRSRACHSTARPVRIVPRPSPAGARHSSSREGSKRESWSSAGLAMAGRQPAEPDQAASPEAGQGERSRRRAIMVRRLHRSARAALFSGRAGGRIDRRQERAEAPRSL